jgi:glycerol-3-phosphate dehydrogenase
MRRSFDSLTNTDFDLLIIGGGITGAGAALDAVTRGLRVALIDQGDFASGTSGVSSKLIHGGLRYLEHGQIRLVAEALSERRRLLRLAPHLVWPLRFVLPFYHGSRLPAWRGRTGLWLYDLLAGSHNLGKSRRVVPAELRRSYPGLKLDGLTEAAEYWDAQTDDARLCLAVLRTAHRFGACVANYVAAVGFDKSGGRITATHVRDRVTSREGVIRARLVLNATGPWVDSVERLAGPVGPARVQPTKGVHLVVDGRGLSAAFLLLHPHDGRVFFVIPWQRYALIGTTDTNTNELPERLCVTADEETYLLAGFNHYFDPPLTQTDVRGRFAGLRPLLAVRPGEPSARSREYAVWDGPAGMVSVAGGKLTTYRHMAEGIIDTVATRLGNAERCRTRNLPLDGTPVEPWPIFEKNETDSLTRAGIELPLARHLMSRYGRRAMDVATTILRGSEWRLPLTHGEPECRGEILYQHESEMAVVPGDHLYRRTRLGYFHPDLRLDSLIQSFDPSRPG